MDRDVDYYRNDQNGRRRESGQSSIRSNAYSGSQDRRESGNKGDNRTYRSAGDYNSGSRSDTNNHANRGSNSSCNSNNKSNSSSNSSSSYNNSSNRGNVHTNDRIESNRSNNNNSNSNFNNSRSNNYKGKCNDARHTVYSGTAGRGRSGGRMRGCRGSGRGTGSSSIADITDSAINNCDDNRKQNSSGSNTSGSSKGVNGTHIIDSGNSNSDSNSNSNSSNAGSSKSSSSGSHCPNSGTVAANAGSKVQNDRFKVQNDGSKVHSADSVENILIGKAISSEDNSTQHKHTRKRHKKSNKFDDKRVPCPEIIVGVTGLHPGVTGSSQESHKGLKGTNTAAAKTTDSVAIASSGVVCSGSDRPGKGSRDRPIQLD